MKAYSTSEQMPPINETVIVSGGIALWNGSEWISMVYSGPYPQPILLAVTWWIPLEFDKPFIDHDEIVEAIQEAGMTRLPHILETVIKECCKKDKNPFQPGGMAKFIDGIVSEYSS